MKLNDKNWIKPETHFLDVTQCKTVPLDATPSYKLGHWAHGHTYLTQCDAVYFRKLCVNVDETFGVPKSLDKT